ncbi:DUF6221 family protein [Streptomyces sp. NPDC093223]|uniref:DUF6221 family protein n=1 Tax=Streptomyces sp. NPDC093223 TaxID=3366033 RepID=UPI0038002F9C
MSQQGESKGPVVWLRETMDAAQRDAETATASPWHASEHKYDEDFEASIGGWPEGADIAGHGYEGGGVDTMATARHMVRHQPATVLTRITADRKLLADLLTEKHYVGDDTWYRCPATGESGDRDGTQDCTCGRDGRVDRRVRLLAESWGWTEEAL